MLTPGYLIRSQPWSETSLLLELWTPEGRIGAIARGARRPRSRWLSVLRQWRLLQLAWRGRGELMTLTAAEPVPGRWQPLRGRQLYCGHYANELILRLTVRASPSLQAFAVYQILVEQLGAASHVGLEVALRCYELELLKALGFLPELLQRGIAEPKARYQLDGDGGLVRGSSGYAGEHLRAIAERRFDDPQILRTARDLMRSLLGCHLHGKPLRSRDLFGARQS